MSQELEKIINYKFKNKDLLQEALTHPSIIHNSQDNVSFNYERLEFLGDAVLSLIITESLLKKFPQADEGELAKKRSYLIKGESLVSIGDNIDIKKFILLSETEDKSGGRNNKNIQENVIESLIGAIYLDGGFDECYKFVTREWHNLIEKVKVTPIEPKTFVQEWAQDKHLSFPKYSLINKSGTDHNPEFTSEIYVEGYPAQIGKGNSKKASEKQAANNFIKNVIRHD